MQEKYKNDVKRHDSAAFSRKLLTVALSAALMLGASILPAAAAKYAGIVVDAKSGKVLYSEDADSPRYPASLTKMMTLYLVFEALEAGRISPDDRVTFSENASKEPPSKLGIRSGQSITVEQAVLALVTRSANDAATALGEFIGGSESGFAQMMTAKARSLGMRNTIYRNANGLPNDEQMTTARDQARLGVALRQHFPQYYGYFSTRSFKFGKQTIGNHNRLLGAVRGVDGIKTGYTRAAGYNLVTSAVTDDRSIVGVVMGSPSGAQRDAKMRGLVERYLPSAARTPAENIIAKFPSAALPKTTQIAAAAPAQPAVQAPVPAAPAAPVISATTSRPVVTASIAAVPTKRVAPPARATEKVEVAYAPPDKEAPAEVALRAITPQAKPAPKAAAASAPAKREEEIDRTTTASITPNSSWYIQIGVSQDRDQALDLLRSAQDKGGKVLRSATPFTVAYNSGDGRLFRARFSGFEDQKTATDACKSLKKVGIACWATSQ